MKRFVMLVCAAVGMVAAYGQYMPQQAGTVFTYEVVDFEDNGSTDTYGATVTDVTTSGEGIVTATVVEKHRLESSLIGEVENTVTYTYNPADKMTVNTLLTSDDFKQMTLMSLKEMFMQAGQYPTDQDMEAISAMIRPKGDVFIELPAEADAGASIPNSAIRATIEGQPMGVKITKGTYQGYEEIEVPAGKFNCLKVTYTTTIIGQPGDTKVTAWYAPGVGLVKQNEADKKGKEKNSTVLKEIKNN